MEFEDGKPSPQSADTRDLDSAVVANQQRLAGVVLPDSERLRTIMGLAENFTQLGGIFDEVVHQELALSPVGVLGVVQAERQYRAIKEQTETLNAGQFAMWRQTPEGRAYLAWEGAALALLRLIEDRDALVSAAIEEDIARHLASKPIIGLVGAAPDVVDKPTEDEFTQRQEFRTLPGCMGGLVLLWFGVEIVISIFGAPGLLNNWLILAIGIALLLVANVGLKSNFDAPGFGEALSKFAGYEKDRSDWQETFQQAEDAHSVAVAAWAEAVEKELGYSMESPKVDWIKLPEDRTKTAQIKSIVLSGRTKFPSPEQLPRLTIPAGITVSGEDFSSSLNRMLAKFAAGN